MMVVTDPDELNIVTDAINPGRPLPAAADTMDLVLSDITVCKTPAIGINPSQNDTETYIHTDPTAEWLSLKTSQFAGIPTSPKDFCEISPKDDDGAVRPAYNAGDVPSILTTPGVRVEGQTVLTNGVNVGSRPGTPAAPGALVGGARRTVVAGQELRMRIANCAHLRYFPSPPHGRWPMDAGLSTDRGRYRHHQ